MRALVRAMPESNSLGIPALCEYVHEDDELALLDAGPITDCPLEDWFSLLHRIDLGRHMEDRSRPLSTTVHELKNPILAIERLSGLLLEKESLSENARRKLGLIHSSAKEASGYLEELDLSSVPVLPEKFFCEPVNVGDLARQVVKSFRTHAEYKDQALRCEASDERCMVVGDSVRLREAMNNLVSNALKYTPNGGTIVVQVERCEEAVCFSVSDDGPGLSEEERKRLFEPFQRPGPQPTDGEGSSGLGLYIVKEIVDRHGGNVEVEATKGEGSTFRLVFPAPPLSSSGDGESVHLAVSEIFRVPGLSVSESGPSA